MTALAAALLLLSASGQGSQDPPMPADMETAFRGWTRCIDLELGTADAGTPARQVADAVLRSCQFTQDAMLAEHARWLNGSNLSEREKAQVRRGMERSVRDLRRNVTRLVREMRRD